MRDVFETMFQGESSDPMEAARRNMRPALHKRFYREATAGQGGADGFPVLLDGRPVRTPAGNPLSAPTVALAEAIAAEWEAQQDAVDPAAMPLTRLANSILDGVAVERAAVAAEIANYLGSDLLFYRAEGPAALAAEQERHWDPVLAWAASALGARFILSGGVVYVDQPARALAAARTAIPDDPWRLGAVHSIATLTGSALLALAVLHGRLTTAEAWAAAHVDEDWNMAQWGRDDLALARRAFREAEMHAAGRVLALAG